MKLKVYKTQKGFKVYQKTLKLSFPFSKPTVFHQGKKRLNGVKYDLVFKDIKNAYVYIELIQKSKYELEDKLYAVNVQLKEIFNKFQINPKDFNWVDAWCGAMLWGIGISRITNNAVYCVDIDNQSYEPLIEGVGNVEFLKADTYIESFPSSVNALFLRSSIGASSIKRILENNPNLELVVIIPEGLNSNESMPFKNELKLLKEFFEIAQRENLFPDISIKGSHTNVIKFNGEVPVLFAKKRKT